MIVGGGALEDSWSKMRSWGRGPHDGISALISALLRESLLSLCSVRTPWESHACRPGRVSHQNPAMLAPWSRAPSELWENKCLLLNHPVCGIFLWWPKLTKAPCALKRNTAGNWLSAHLNCSSFACLSQVNLLFRVCFKEKPGIPVSYSTLGN